MMLRHLHFSLRPRESLSPFCHALPWFDPSVETSEASDPSSIDRFLDHSDPTLLGDRKMAFMLSLGQASKM
jgi:hypothetical protein